MIVCLGKDFPNFEGIAPWKSDATWTSFFLCEQFLGYSFCVFAQKPYAENLPYMRLYIVCFPCAYII